MADLFVLSQAQTRRIERYCPLSHGIARVDDRRVVSAIENRLRWRNAPAKYGLQETVYNQFIRWSSLGFLQRWRAGSSSLSGS